MESTASDFDFCGLDFISPTDWPAESLESAADYLFFSLPPTPSNDLGFSDFFTHSQIGIDNAQPSVQPNESIVSVESNEEMNSSWKSLGFSFDKNRNSAFVEWKAINPDLPLFHEPKKILSLQKRCIRFLKDINNHKILAPLSYNKNSICRSMAVSSNYDKVAIHHLVAERKRREQMSDVFSALRTLVPVKPKNASRATVLLQTKDYLIHLRKRIQQLQQRNRELEALL